MNILCKIVGHKYVEESQSTVKHKVKIDTWEGEWDVHTQIFTVYMCKRCMAPWKNTVNFGMPAKKK